MIYKFGEKIFLRGVQYIFVARSKSGKSVWVLDSNGSLRCFPASWEKSTCRFFDSPVLPFLTTN